MKKVVLFTLLAIAVQYCFAQPAGEPTTEQKEEKIYDHYVGAQINLMISHLINSSANSIGTGNPYLFTYSMNNRKSGWGIRVGVGANSISTSSAISDGSTTTKNNDMQLRAGVEKTIEISNKWTAGTGVDAVFNYNDDNLTNSNQGLYDTVVTTTKTKLANYGGGVFGKVSYHISNKILLGTECSYYYVSGTNNQTVDVYRTLRNTPPSTTETKSTPDFSKGNINLPIVLYFIVKF